MNFSLNNSLDENIEEINITSLVDVVFMLLIFFMVTTTFQNSHSIDVNLPTSSSGDVKTQNDTITISIDKQEHLFINDKPVSLITLEQELKNAKQTTNKVSITISADKTVQHGTIVKVLDSTQKAGIENVGIATIPTE